MNGPRITQFPISDREGIDDGTGYAPDEMDIENARYEAEEARRWEREDAEDIADGAL